MVDVTTIATYNLEDSNWVMPDLFVGELITIKNIGGTPISVFITKTTDIINDDYLTNLGINPSEIGGLTYELSTVDVTEKLWVSAPTGTGSLSIRIKGTLDPSEDITHVSSVLDQLSIDFNTHKSDLENPHHTTKDHVQLGNIPNAISDNPEEDNSDILATTVATATIVTNIENHKSDLENPHHTTKDHVQLGNVPNFPKANEQTAIDTTNDQAFMTPAMSYVATRLWVEMTMSVRAQTVVKGLTGSRILGWSTKDCSAPSLILEKVSNKSYKINSGLQVAYADNGKTRISSTLDTAVTLNIPSDLTSTITYYVYTDIDTRGKLINISYTTTQPFEGMDRRFYVGDFFNVADNTMYDKDNNIIKRVYLGKIYIVGGNISSIIPSPIGYEYDYPVTVDLKLSGRYLIDSPFICPVNTIAEVEYNYNWGPTYWNDQIGVIATPYPNDVLNKCVLQCGQMGFLSCGKESGSPFGSSFETITSPLRTRIRFTKKY